MECPIIPCVPENLYVREKFGKYLVFNPNVPSWIVTDSLGICVLKHCDGHRNRYQILEAVQLANHSAHEHEVFSFLSRVASARLFDDKKTPTKPPNYKLQSLYLNITDACNLQCTYCYARSRTGTDSTLVLEDYFRVLESAKRIAGEITITFTGGEALLYPHIYDVALYARGLGHRTFLLSNGTLINENNVQKVAAVFDDIKISLDGSKPEVNDQTRGAGSFEAVQHALRLLDRAGKQYLLSMTVTKKNIQDVANMNRLYGAKLSYAPYFHLHSCLDGLELKISGREYYEALIGGAEINPYGGIDAIIKNRAQDYTIPKCSIADGSISIASNGDVYPCQLLHFPEFKAGNVRRSSLDSIFTQSPILLALRAQTVECIDGCADCPISLVCGGGCLARHYYETGSISTAGAFCEYEQLAIFDALLDQYELQPVVNQETGNNPHMRSTPLSKTGCQ